MRGVWGRRGLLKRGWEATNGAPERRTDPGGRQGGTEKAGNTNPRPWHIRDTQTGELHYARSDEAPPSTSDIGYLGRLPQPDGAGSLLAIAGIHPTGSLGVAHWLTTDIATLWGQVGDRDFSVLIRTEYDPDTNEPVKTEMATPLYRHDRDEA